MVSTNCSICSAKGERHARRDVMEMAEKLGVDLPTKRGRIEEALFVKSCSQFLGGIYRRQPRPAPSPPPITSYGAPPSCFDGIDMSKKTTSTG